MLAHDHALLGGLAALEIGTLFTHDPATLALMVGVTAAWSDSPDLDEDGSTVSRQLGLASRVVGWCTGRITGGHRHATHSLLGAVGVWFLVDWLVRLGALPVGILLAASLAFGLRLLLPRRKGDSLSMLVASAVIALVVVRNHIATDWLPWACSGGVLAHLVGDLGQGVPLLWPYKRRFAVGLLGATDSMREHVIGWLMVVLFAVMVFVQIVHPALASA